MAEGLPRKDPKDQGFGRLLKKDEDGNTPLHVAALAGNADVIRALLDIDMDALEVRNTLGQTPLYLSVVSGNNEAVECLLEAGADLTTKAEDGTTIWHAAALAGGDSIMMLLAEATKVTTKGNIPAEVEARDSINSERGYGYLRVKDKSGNTPLHIAAKAGHCDVIKALLELDMSVLNDTNARGQTALYLAVTSGNSDAVQILVQAGANTKCVTNDGCTLYHAAAALISSKISNFFAEPTEPQKPAGDGSERKIPTRSHTMPELKLSPGKDSKARYQYSPLKSTLRDKNIPSPGHSKSDPKATSSKQKRTDNKLKKLNVQFPPIEGRTLSKWEKIYRVADNIDSSSDSES